MYRYRAWRSIWIRLLTLPEVPSRSGQTISRIVAVGKLRPQPFDLADGRIVQAADAKQNFEVARILLPAVAGEARVHVRVHALQRLQNRSHLARNRAGRSRGRTNRLQDC